MKYKRFEDLPVWKSGIDLAVKIYSLTSTQQFVRQRSLRDQLERASVSISNNIAEGFERGTTQEVLTFLYIARGSSGEVRSMLCLLERLPTFSELRAQVRALIAQASDISRQLGAWAAALQNSEGKGLRHMTQRSRRISQLNKDREEFLEELRRTHEERIASLETSRQGREETGNT